MKIGNVERDVLRAYLAKPIHKVFEVSTMVIEIRLRKCGICPNHL